MRMSAFALADRKRGGNWEEKAFERKVGLS